MNTVDPTPWSLFTKVAFRFIFIYFLLYIFPFNNLEDVFDWSLKIFINTWDWLITWLGENILQVSITTKGVGDTTWEITRLFIIGVISLTGTVIWSLLDKDRISYSGLSIWFFIIIRYYLAINLLAYGFAKVIKMQFPGIEPYQLVMPIGRLNPMALLWVFMGHSYAYNVFTGLAEVIGGFLLFFRRTTLLGALFAIGVLSNVVMLNFSYGVFVKLVSLHLLIMAILLIIPNASRLLNFFLLNKEIKAQSEVIRFNQKWKKTIYTILKSTFIVYMTLLLIIIPIKHIRLHGDHLVKPPLYGIYNVQSFVYNADTLPPLTTDSIRWNQIIVNYERNEVETGVALVRYMNDIRKWFFFQPDTLQKEIIFYPIEDTINTSKLNYFTDSVIFYLFGNIQEDCVYIIINRLDENTFRLLNSQFKWANND